MIIVDLSLATICFLYNNNIECAPVLVGRDTPIGEFNLIQRFTNSPGLGGDVLQFKETSSYVFAIHRIWTLNPTQRREYRIRSNRVSNRINITGGCINVENHIYDKLIRCCINHPLKIHN